VRRRLALFVNPAAAGGRALRRLPEARAELEALGAEYRLVDTSSLDDAREEAVKAAAAGETVVAVGGDGMVGGLAGVLRHTGSPLGIVPAGRGNDFARVLGIPKDPREAARLVFQGEERLVDVAECDGKPFVGIASLGFDSEANKIANEARFVRGNLVYLYAAVKACAAWKPATFEVVVDGERHPVTGWSVGVCNNKAYGGGMFVAPDAKLDDGELDPVLCAETGKLKFLFGILPRLFKGSHVNEPNFTFLRGRRIEISADRPFAVYADGDPIADLPVTVTVDERSLRVIAPAA
jgi:YegS/Rv2252/BmrU family lipid kinase